MNILSLKREALNTLRGKWGASVLLTVIVFAISGMIPAFFEVPLSGGFEAWLLQDTTPIGATLVSTLISLLLLPLSIALMWYFLDLLRGNGPKISDVFNPYKDLGIGLKIIGTSIMQSIFLFLWFLLLFVPGVIKSISYSQTYYLLRDNPELSIFEAITESRKRMVGLKWNYFLLCLSFIGWGLLAIITFGIGLLWLMPYMSTTFSAFYDKHIADKKKELE
ncbi:DUF975 family protein [Niallia circulans]|uniref:DUF975 family protein n=1 Tax=Niallia circulans TaxID=1397 RepID=A0A553SHT5_NIACI|nr:DUF975 family protein [Niallia circulans]TRZ36553.1 DUF975 family protein [Niallia circulans]